VNTTGCKGEDNEVNFLEHVQAFISVKSTRRGKVNQQSFMLLQDSLVIISAVIQINLHFWVNFDVFRILV